MSFKYHGPEHDMLKELCVLQVTPQRLNMITTLFDPNQFGGKFFYRSGGTSTLFIDLSEIERVIPPWIRNKIPVQERFDTLQQIAQCLIEDLWMLVEPDDPYYNSHKGYLSKHLMDDAREHGFWIAFAVFLEYFPELKNGPAYMFCLGHPH